LKRDLPPERLDLPAILASSRLDAKKNHLGLVRAFAEHALLQAKANLVIITGALDDPLRQDDKAGPGEKEVLAQIREVIREYDLWGKISAFALQGQTTLAAAYRFFAGRGSVFALTALYEPFGLAPLEAAAAGLPVVVTQNGGPSESLQEGDQQFGVLVDPQSPADIARGLQSVLSDPQAWRSFSILGRQRVLDRYTWERTAHGYLTTIEDILANPTAFSSQERLPIHAYFLHPSPENEISLETLRRLYFK
ncbi:MAG: glycosyltransferase, partial [Anaerolineales bacterium]